MRYAIIFGLLTMCCLLAACGKHSDNIIIGGSHGVVDIHLGLEGQRVTLHAQDAPEATINADGDFQVNQQPVAVNASERELLKSYYENAMMIPTDAIATGKAGAAIGAQALKSVASQLAGGNPDHIKQDVEAKAATVKAAALKICQDLGNTKTAQDQLAAQLPAFKPYGNVIDADSVSNCEKDQKD